MSAGCPTDLDLLEVAWRKCEQDLACAVLLMAGSMTVHLRAQVAHQLEGDEATPARRLIRWALEHGEHAKRGPVHAYLAFHGDPDTQELCVAADQLLGIANLTPADFLMRVLGASNFARIQYRGEKAVQDAKAGVLS